jgi:hypothetical protein
LSAEERAVILAAVAAGKSQAQVAKEFNVNKATVGAIVKASRKAVPGPENPLAANWRETHATKAIRTISNRLESIEDDHKAVTAATKVLEDLGLYRGKQDQVQIRLEQWFGAYRELMARPENQRLTATMKTDARLISATAGQEPEAEKADE